MVLPKAKEFPMKLRSLVPLALLGASITAPALAASPGSIEVSRLRAVAGTGALGHGSIVIGAGDPADSGASSDLPIYEAAVVGQLARAGYDTQTTSATGGQIAEVSLSQSEVRPAEPRHKPVSGGAETYISNRGSGFGLSLNINLSKPKGPVISTRLDVRIRDRATNAVLWEGHAETTTRATAANGAGGGIDNSKTAARLSEALFAGFPQNATIVTAN